MTPPDGLPPPPIEPDDAECCHRHCSPCIFDYYRDALDRWRTLVADRGFDPAAVLAAMEEGRRGQ